MNAKEIRELFPITNSIIYLDTASRCPLAIPVYNSLERYLDFCSRYGREYKSWWELSEQLRKKIAQLIGSKSTEIGFCDSTTHAINILAHGYSWKKDDNIVTANIEFPSNIYPWFSIKQYGVDVRLIECKNGMLPLYEIEKYCDSHTRILSLSHVQAANGYRIDLTQIGDFCRDRGIIFCVDATQSCGVFPIDVRTSKIDFLAVSTYKWMMATDSLAFYYCSEKIIGSLSQTYLGWSGRLDRNDFKNHHMKYPMEAKKFELGNLNFLAMQGFDAAISLYNEIGQDEILDYTLNLAEEYRKCLKSYKQIKLLSDFDAEHKSMIITFDLKNRFDFFSVLEKNRITCCLKHNGIRISPFIFNDFDEVLFFNKLLYEYLR